MVTVNELKYLSTKTSTIILGTDLNKWYEENVQTVLLQDLEEFQVSFFFFLISNL